MGAPEHVPVDGNQSVRGYSSPPRRPASWRPDRPGEVIETGQPRGQQLGHQGPDQGYMLALARRFEGKLTLTAGEHEKDALAGAVGVALKRASLHGRAPVVHDLTVALLIWGYLDTAPQELAALRRPLFEEVSHPHHYGKLRQVVGLVSEESLRQTPAQVAEAHAADWRSLLLVGQVPTAR